MPDQISNSSSNFDSGFKKTLILVPQGVEHQAVKKNLKQSSNFIILAIPIGGNSVGEYLKGLNNLQEFNQVIVMGLCGSLNPSLKVGDIVIYSECLYKAEVRECGFIPENSFIPENISQGILVKSLTSDYLISSASAKQSLFKKTNCDVVDMEGFSVLEFFAALDFPEIIPVGMIRVVSDDCKYDLPNLENAIDENGNLKPLKLALAFIKQPLAAWRLIRGSLKSLKILSQVALILNQKN